MVPNDSWTPTELKIETNSLHIKWEMTCSRNKPLLEVSKTDQLQTISHDLHPILLKGIEVKF